jgi:uncharacterized protein (TIGR03435 family)
MIKILSLLMWTFTLGSVAFSQTSGSFERFEAADVHLSNPTRSPGTIGPLFHAGRYELRGATMIDLVAIAYGVVSDVVWGGPNWLGMYRFDVIAKAPPDASPEARRAMLQTLLTERFVLSVHRDTKPLAIYALTVGKHPTLKESKNSADSGCTFSRQASGSGGTIPMLGYTCHDLTMGGFAEAMSTMVGVERYLGGKRVADRTGLQGSWDFTLRYPALPETGGSDRNALFDAIDKDLGLKLEPVNVPMAVLAVDRVNQEPTPNLPDVAEKLQSPVAREFEVAVIKRSSPESIRAPIQIQIQRGGQISLKNTPLKSIIEQAWSVSDDTLVGAPKWLGEDGYDITAKAPAGVAVDIDLAWLMVRALLQDRFKLEVHTEARPLSAYTLVAVHPKLTKADPTTRAGFKDGFAVNGQQTAAASPNIFRVVTAQNVTMAQFAEHLQKAAPSYIHSPVLDATALAGTWDFTLKFTLTSIVQVSAKRNTDLGQADSGPAVASDLGSGLNLFEAVEKQLGLKLRSETRPVSVLVIDHIDRTPVEN